MPTIPLITPNFCDLIDGVDFETFRSEVFGHQYRQFKVQVENSHATRGLSAGEYLLWSHEQRLQRLLNVYDDNVLVDMPRRRASKDLFRWAIDRYLSGNVLSLTDVQEIEPSAAALSREIAQTLLAHVSCDLCLVPEGAHLRIPLASHQMDAFLIPTEGTVDCHALLQTDLHPEHHLQTVLDVNNSAYFPCVSELTISAHGGPAAIALLRIVPYTSAEYCDCLVEAATEINASLRMSFPKNGTQMSAYHSALSKLSEFALDERLKKTAWDKLALRIADRYRPSLDDHLKVAQSRNSFDSRTLVMTRKGSLFAFGEENDGIYVYVPGLGGIFVEESQPGGLIFPRAAFPLLRWISQRDGPFCADDLPKEFSESARIATVRRLTWEGALQVVAV